MLRSASRYRATASAGPPLERGDPGPDRRPVRLDRGPVEPSRVERRQVVRGGRGTRPRARPAPPGAGDRRAVGQDRHQRRHSAPASPSRPVRERDEGGRSRAERSPSWGSLLSPTSRASSAIGSAAGSRGGRQTGSPVHARPPDRRRDPRPSAAASFVHGPCPVAGPEGGIGAVARSGSSRGFGARAVARERGRRGRCREGRTRVSGPRTAVRLVRRASSITRAPRRRRCPGAARRAPSPSTDPPDASRAPSPWSRACRRRSRGGPPLRGGEDPVGDLDRTTIVVALR